MQQRRSCRWVIVLAAVMLSGMAHTLSAEPREKGWAIPVQVPYEAPPKGQDLQPAESVPQNTKPLTAEEVQRAEALLPLLEGKQEFWAMGEFVHLGEPSVPVLVKGLSMPGPRIRCSGPRCSSQGAERDPAGARTCLASGGSIGPGQSRGRDRGDGQGSEFDDSEGRRV